MIELQRKFPVKSMFEERLDFFFCRAGAIWFLVLCILTEEGGGKGERKREQNMTQINNVGKNDYLYYLHRLTNLSESPGLVSK